MKPILSLFLFLTLSACSLLQPSGESSPPQNVPEPAVVTAAPSPSATEPPTLPDSAGISIDELRNAEYTLGSLAQTTTIQLSDGVYQEGTEAEFISVRMGEIVATGDLNGDGKAEVVVPVAENYGGTGAFVFLAVYKIDRGEPAFVTSVAIDDRPIIEDLSIENGEIYLSAIVHGPNDPMCCPTLWTMRRYRLTDTGLLMNGLSTRTPTGADRIITITSPEDRAEVSGIVNVKGDITIAPFENNLVYRIYDAGGVEIVAGPVEVSASDLGAPGTFDRSIDMAPFAGSFIRVVIQDVDVADGSLFAMDSIILTVRE